MKNRDYKIFRPNTFYHLFNRGINKQKIFLDDNDYLGFLKRLKLILGLTNDESLHLKAVPAGTFGIATFCLMPNHFHFLIRQNTEVGIPTLFLKLCTSYSMYFNRKYQRIGPLFQDTFKAKPITNDAYLTYLSAYIHTNPSEPFQYPFSSLPDILGERNEQICQPNLILDLFDGEETQYKKFISEFSESHKNQIKALLFEDEEEEKGNPFTKKGYPFDTSNDIICS